MRRIQSLFKTLLMLIPMTAVPMMAIFGIPQFFPVSASPTAGPAQITDTSHLLELRVGHSDALLVRNVSTMVKLEEQVQATLWRMLHRAIWIVVASPGGIRWLGHTMPEAGLFGLR